MTQLNADKNAVVDQFKAASPADQQEMLRQALDAASREAATGAIAAFAGVTKTDRAKLYGTVIWLLCALAAIALGCAAWALSVDKDSAAFFTFAGLALGGVTGILGASASS